LESRNEKACRGRRCGRLFESQNSNWEEECCCSIFRPFGRRRRPEARSGREEVPRFDEFKIPKPAAIASADIASQPCKCCIAT
jgi:hypothetical protein